MMRKVSNICFDRVEIEKAITSNREPSVFFRISHNYSSNLKEIKKPQRSDIQIKGSVLKH